jgi:hypothetical protein
MKVKVLEFNMGDVDDPQVYAAQPIWEWQQSDCGRWVMENALDIPVWHTGLNHMTYGHTVSVIADLKEEHVTYFTLKWGIK